MIIMGTEPPDWFRPNTYSVWIYDRGDDHAPIFLVAFEWELGDLRGVRGEDAFVWEEEGKRVEELPECDDLDLGPGAPAVDMAKLIESGKLKRIGSLPTIGKYAQAPVATSLTPHTR
jgi:hypothetical protein